MIRMPDIWSGGQLLAMSGLDGETDFRSGLVLRTVFSENAAMEVKRPESSGQIVFPGGHPFRTELTGDFFTVENSRGNGRGVIADAHHLLLEGEFNAELSEEQLQTVRGNGRILIAARGFMNEKLLAADFDKLLSERRKFIEKARLPADISENTARTALKALSQLKTQIYSHEGQIGQLWSTPDRWPHGMMWLWDSVFHAVGMRHYAPSMAKQLLRSVFDVQRDDGFIPHMASPYQISGITQPPVLGLGMAAVNMISPDPEWLAELAPKLGRFLKWLMANRDSDGAGLVEWAIEAHESCRSGESGMDNSPRFDGAIQLDATDFNAYLAHECELMAEFIPTEAAFWLERRNNICRLINERLWSDKLGMYVDYDIVSGKRADIMASSGFLPLLCGAPSHEQAERLCAHLDNPETFGTPFGIPSVAACNKVAYSKDMWRGPVWVNINYLIALGLERYGFTVKAAEIMRATRLELEKFYLKYGTFFEFYDDRREVEPQQLLRKDILEPGGEFDIYRHVIHDYGWTGTLFLEILNNKKWRV